MPWSERIRRRYSRYRHVLQEILPINPVLKSSRSSHSSVGQSVWLITIRSAVRARVGALLHCKPLCFIFTRNFYRRDFKGQTMPLRISTSLRDSIVVSISACHADDPGSIPGRGVFHPGVSQPLFSHCHAMPPPF